MTPLFAVLLLACTENMVAREFGGNLAVDLPLCTKLVNATWKADDLWYLTRTMRSGETAEVYTFTEQSTFGVMNGTVVLTEHCAGTEKKP